MTGAQRRWLVLAAVVLLVVTVVQAVRSGRSGEGGDGSADDAALRAAREAAALTACPSGVGAGLPDLTLPCLGGGPAVPLRGPGTGRPVVVNAWATWCGPCTREMPELVELAARAAGRVDLLGVLTQDDQRQALEFARQLGVRYPSVVDDDGAFFRRYSAGPPVTVFVRADGSVAHVERGEMASLQEVLDLTRAHLGVAL